MCSSTQARDIKGGYNDPKIPSFYFDVCGIGARREEEGGMVAGEKGEGGGEGEEGCVVIVV